MSMPLASDLDCGGARRIINLAAANASGQPVTFEQLQAAIEGIAWKDDVRSSASTNVTVASPGATIGGITMVASDRVLLRGQTAQTENGLYIWNGAAVPMTRSLDASTFDELEGAVVNVTEGPDAGVQFRQTQVNGVIGTNNVAWTTMGSSAPAASEATAGIAEIATQGETDTGTDDARMVTPLKLKTASFLVRKYVANIGDGTTTSIAVTHNIGNLDVQAYAYEVGGLKREILVEKQHTSTTVTTFVFGVAPAAASVRVVIQG